MLLDQMSAMVINSNANRLGVHGALGSSCACIECSDLRRFENSRMEIKNVVTDSAAKNRISKMDYSDE